MWIKSSLCVFFNIDTHKNLNSDSDEDEDADKTISE